MDETLVVRESNSITFSRNRRGARRSESNSIAFSRNKRSPLRSGIKPIYLFPKWTRSSPFGNQTLQPFPKMDEELAVRESNSSTFSRNGRGSHRSGIKPHNLLPKWTRSSLFGNQTLQPFPKMDETLAVRESNSITFSRNRRGARRSGIKPHNLFPK